ncbi:MAG: diheme cytochrome c-553 [Thermoanaerobaculia bacterium]|jgi:cytochrome c553
MKHRTLLISIAVLMAAFSAFGEANKPNAQVERGKYLVSTMGCNDCHTPLKMGANGPEPDMSRMLTGHPESLVMPPPPALPEGPWVTVVSGTNTAWAGPWGVSFTANLTPDPETGLGKWSEKQFIDTMKTGRHLGMGRPILPPMPWFMIGAAHDEDIKAIFAYLKSLPPVKNKVPQPIEPAAAK